MAMETVPPEPVRDLTASDILSPQLWARSTTRPSLGLDVTCTKIAVDFQSMTEATAEACIRQNLDALREATHTDATLIALFDEEGEHVESLSVSKGMFTQCTPEVLKGDSLEALPWLRSRLEHTRILELRDTANTRREQAAEGARLQQLNIGALLLVGFAVQEKVCGFLALCSAQPREGWDVNLHLLLKLIGSSFASGLERMRVQKHLKSLQERTDLAMYTGNDGLWDFDAEHNRVYFSPRWKGMLGYADDEMNNAPDWRQLVHPDDMPRVQAAIRDHVAGKTPIFESIHRMRHRSGEWRWVVSRAKARVDKNGRLLRLVGTELDITERKLYEDALFREKESAQITLQSIGDGVITTDQHSNVEYINPVAEELTGWRLEDAQGRSIDEIFRAFHEETCEPLENPHDGRDPPHALDQVRATDAADPPRRQRALRREHRRADSRRAGRHVRRRARVPRRQRIRELNRKLSYHASHDVLTGLVNRREFESRLERALKSAKARETSYALCHIDLDQFKIINDTCGHSAGDALLGQVGALLKSKIRWRDTLARLGGDEFGLLLESCSLEEALRTAESLREAVRNFRFVWEERTFRLGASIGVVPIAAENEDVASHPDRRGQCLRGGQGSRPQSRAQLRRERHRSDAPAARDAMGGAHQQRARGSTLRVVSPDHPAAAAPGPRRALRVAAADARRKRQDRHARPFHRRGRTLRHHAEYRSLGDRKCLALAGVRSGRARAARAVLDQPLRAERSATTSSCRS